MNRTLPLTRLSCAVLTLLVLTHCQGRAPSTAEKQPATNASPATPPEIQQVAEALLGSEAEVLAVGDFARTGQQQVLVINRLKSATGGAPGILLTRAVIAEKDGARWKEVLGCDEHLKNPRGYLAGAPVAPVSSWRLKYEFQEAGQGLVLYFTPLAQPTGSALAPIGVRWNSRLERYQSLDRTQQHFLGERPALETPAMRLRG